MYTAGSSGLPAGLRHARYRALTVIGLLRSACRVRPPRSQWIWAATRQWLRLAPGSGNQFAQLQARLGSTVCIVEPSAVPHSRWRQPCLCCHASNFALVSRHKQAENAWVRGMQHVKQL